MSSSEIRLSWQDNAGTEQGFRIERCAGTACGSFTQIAVVGQGVTGYVDAGLARNTSYSYRVRAYNGGGASALLQHGDREDEAQVRAPSRRVALDVYRVVVAAVRRGPPRRFRGA